MCAQLLFCLLLFACQIIFNESSVITENTAYVENGESPTIAETSTLPEGYITFPDVHAAYKLHEEGSKWYEGRDRCIAEGARLAIADTPEKIEHINSLRTERDESHWIHVGIYQTPNTNDGWKRIDNDLPVKSIPWVPNFPDGVGNCVGISVSLDKLVNYECDDDNEYYVCEIPV